MPSVKVFLSHKAKDGTLAEKIQQALCSVFPDLEIFLSEEIPKSDDFRKKIWSALGKARFFVLLYTDPKDDWSWCFFEVGAYRSIWREEAKNRHPIYCLHSKESSPPSPLSDLQTVTAEVVDIDRWLRDICKLLNRRAPPRKRMREATEKIESAVRARSILEERTVKPYIWITPRWPAKTPPNFNSAKLPNIPLENAIVTIDPESATQLGFGDVPDGLELLQFLRMLDCDSGNQQSAQPYWTTRFFSSLTKAIKNNLLLQEVAYFRHESGSILRPIVASVSKSRDGALCRLKVLFIQALGAPLANQPSPVQRLADGVRLGVRTSTEVINGFSGKLAKIYCDKIKSDAEVDLVARNYPVGRRVLEAIETIAEEARAHGIRPEEAPPILFPNPSDQAAYEQIRVDSFRIWERLKDVAQREDKEGKGIYKDTEKLLSELKEKNEQYLKLAIPRLNELLVADDTGARRAGTLSMKMSGGPTVGVGGDASGRPFAPEGLHP